MLRTDSFSPSCHLNLFLATAFILICVPVLVVAQGSTPARGFQPGGSYALSDIESINTTNGNLMLNLALGRLAPGRGGLSGQLSLHYNSKLYDSKTEYYQDWDHVVFGQPHVAMRNLLVTSDEGGWRYGTGYELQLINRMNQYPIEMAPQYPDIETIRHYKLRVSFPDGSAREFLPRGFGSPMDEGYYDIRPDGWQTRYNGSYVEDVPYLTNTLTYYSFDGTYIRLEVEHDSDNMWGNNPWTLYFPDGTKVTNFGKRITDRNGNYVEFSNLMYNGYPATQLMDQLGRKVILGWENNADVIRVPGVGGDVVYRIRWKAIQVYKTYSTVVNDHFSPTGYPDMLGQQFVVSEIELPAEAGGLKYIFGYNAIDTGSVPCCTPSYGWGELNSVTTPTGAQAQYQYYLDGQNGPGFAYSWDNILRNQITQKTLTYQQQNDGSSTPVTETWTHSVPSGTIINPDGGVVSQFGDANRNLRTQFPDGRVVEKIWQTNVPQGFTASGSPDPYSGIGAYDRPNDFVKTEFTSIRDASGNLTKTGIKDYSYDKNGNVTSVREYDWVDYGTVPRGGPGSLPTAIPAGAVLKRVTTSTYATTTPDASDSNSNDADSYWNSGSPALKNLITSGEVSNGSTTLTRGEFVYDNPVTTGNLTQQKSWDSTKGAYSNPLTGSNSISTSTHYNQYGSPTLTTDARNVQTRMVYGSVGGFTDLYPTQVQTGYQTALQRTETREYDFSTGLVTRATDVDNNVATATTYDVLGRPTLVKAAEGKTEETRTATEYSDVNRRVIVRSDLSNIGDGKLVMIQHYDQLGRIRLTRQLEDASNPQHAYDETVGIKVQTRYLVSNPCQPASTPTCLAANSMVLGSYQLSSNPYRATTSANANSEPTMGWSRSRTDKGGRLIAVETFSSAGLPAPWGTNAASTGAIVTSYDANATTVMDQAGKLRRSLTDALGRLVRVDEPNANGFLGSLTTPNQTTSYTYDALNNLITVVQGTQQRNFVYDSLKRLTSADNPESGVVGYKYDNNSNLLVKTDARSEPGDANRKVSTHFEYDLLNRLTRRWYNGSSAVSATTHNSPLLPTAVGASSEAKFYYDNQSLPSGAPSFTRGAAFGRLVAQTYGSGSNGDYYGYDKLGRQTLKIQQTGTVNYQMTASYMSSGAVSSLAYPSRRTITNTYDPAGRLTGFSGNLGDSVNRTYSTGMVYSSLGSMLKEQFGANTPVYHKLHYNSRAQLCDVRASNINDEWGGELGALVNYYSNNWVHCGSGSDNNGNVLMSQTIINSVYFEERYTYDSLNRLSSVVEYRNGTNYVGTQQYDYDRWGNRTIMPISTLGTNKQFTISAKNQLGVPSGQPGVMTYDQAGNLTNDTYTGAGHRTYDAENKITSAMGFTSQTATYVYDAAGNRIKRTADGVETWQVYGIGGELLAEYPANGAAPNPQKEYGYRNGQLLVTVAPNAVGNATQNVVWANTVGVNANGNSLMKTAADNWANSGASSTQSILSGNGYVQFIASETTTHRMIGLSKGDTNQDYTDIDFAVYISGTNLCIYEAGISRGCVITYVNGDTIKVAVESGVVKYRKNGAVVYTSSVSPAYPLIVDTALWSNCGTINNVVLSGNLSEGTGVNWLVADHLGTPRMIIDQTGTSANVKRHDYLPFGEELFAPTGGRDTIPGYTAGDGVRQQFTSKERDIETGLDYFAARYYAGTQGRFTSIDPALESANGTNPQSWNRYTYVFNNPLRYIDPLGLWAFSVEYEYYTDDKKKGQVKSAKLVFTKTNTKDDATSLLKQLGYKPGDKGFDNLLKQVGTALGGADSVQSSKLGGDIGLFFNVIENKLRDQKEYERKNPTARDGPYDGDYQDCSMTSCRLAYPTQMASMGAGGIGNQNFGIDEADEMNARQPRAPLDGLRVRDIIRYGRGDKRHFSNVIFVGEDGIASIFSRSGVKGRFETLKINDQRLVVPYGQITGSFRP